MFKKTLGHALFPRLWKMRKIRSASIDELFHRIVERIENDLKLVEDEIQKTGASRVTSTKEIIQHLLTAGGKRIRPVLLLLSARALNYRGMDHIKLAKIAEMLHNATLFHDDVVDRAPYRRSRVAAHVLFGNKMAVLVGDVLLSRAFSELMRDDFFPMAKALSRTVRDLAEGEILQAHAEKSLNLSTLSYLRISRCKTASLFSWCCFAGARLATQDPSILRSLSYFGRYIGMSFQLADDALDFIGDKAKTGKQIGNDLDTGRVTIPIIYAVKRSSLLKGMLRQYWSFNSPMKNKLRTLIIEEVRARDGHLDARRLASLYAEKALRHLDPLADNEYVQTLRNLGEFLALRLS